MGGKKKCTQNFGEETSENGQSEDQEEGRITLIQILQKYTGNEEWMQLDGFCTNGSEPSDLPAMIFMVHR
jgi:hypothetical protein